MSPGGAGSSVDRLPMVGSIVVLLLVLAGCGASAVSPSTPAHSSPTAGVEGVDCSAVERLDPGSPEAAQLLTQLVHVLWRSGQLPQGATGQVLAADRSGDWAIVQASFSLGLEPGIFVLQRAAQGYQITTVWGGVADSPEQIRTSLAARAPGMPFALAACLQPQGFGVPGR